MRKIVVVVLLMALAQTVRAQTATPTPTSTPTETAIPVQALSVLWTLEPEETEEPGQTAALTYVVTIDETVSALLIFAILVVLWTTFLIARYRGWF